MKSQMIEGETCWKIQRADRLTVIVDASDFFRAAKQSMLKAKHSIILIGWDFDTRIEMEPLDSRADGPNKIGQFIEWLSDREPELEVRILKWDVGLFSSLLRGETPFYVLKWIFGKRVSLKLDGAHPKLSAHHMKILVIDDSVAFCGGIDMTVGRWDTPRHLENDPARRSPWGKKMRPWHDATTCLTGPAARSLAELAKDRWLAATGETVQPVTSETDLWPGNIGVDFTGVSVGIARTAPAFGSREQIVEIETATLAIILSAKHSLYIESQYFASRRIAEALAQRLREKDGPEIVIISPLGAGGWLESKFMDSARVRMMNLIRDADTHDRFRIFYPVNEAGTPIYVHAKIMVADDMILKIGSANLNNRSMGFDTECDIIVEAHEDEVVIRKAISARRNALLAEHLGQSLEAISSSLIRCNGSLIKSIEELNTEARGLRAIPLRELTLDEEFFAELPVADPERPAGLKYATTIWLRTRFGRQVP